MSSMRHIFFSNPRSFHHLLLNGLKAHEDHSLSRDDAAQSGDHPGIKRWQTFVLRNLDEAVGCILVHACLRPLHPRLDDVKGVVAQCTEAPRRHAPQQAQERRHRLLPVVRDVAFVLVEEHESESLVASLFHCSC